MRAPGVTGEILHVDAGYNIIDLKRVGDATVNSRWVNFCDDWIFALVNVFVPNRHP